MEKIRVLIVDDRDIIRDGLKLIFSRSESIEIKDDASDGEEALKLVKKNNYDVILMDISMPNMDGIEATKRIKELKSNVKILANSIHKTPTYIRDIMSAGASGFITKGESRESYVEAVKAVNNGAIYLSEEVNDKIYDEVLTYLKTSSEKMMLSI